MINNRQQSGRRRGRGGQRQNNNNGGGGRGLESGNRVDNRARGNAAQMLEKFKTLARDAQQASDRVLTEYYLQFAEHYFRVLSETRARYEENNPNRARQEFANDEGGFEGEEGEEAQEDDDDFGSFRQPQRAQPAPQPQPQRDARPREDRPREDRPRDDRSREDRPREDRQLRDERPRNDSARNDSLRDDRPRDDRPREDRVRRDYAEDRGNRSQSTEARSDEASRDARSDRRPARPLRAPSVANGDAGMSEVSNGADHDQEARLDIGVLPPAFGASAPLSVASVAPPADDDDIAPAPRKRGRPRKDAGIAPVEG